MVEEDTKEILGYLGFALNIILCNVLAHGIYKVYAKRNSIGWSARHFEPLFVTIVWSLLYIGIERNLQIFGGIIGSFNLEFVPAWFLNNLFSIGFLALYIQRAWLIHYDYHSGVALYNLVTNPGLDDERREHLQWFIDNKTNYGSPKYLFRFTIIVVFTINFFLIGWSAISEKTFVYGCIALYSILIFIAMGVTSKLTKLDDNFFIRKELLVEFRLFAICFLFSGILVMFGPGIGWDYASFFFVEISVIACFSMGFVATYWVLGQTEKYGLDEDIHSLNYELPPNTPPINLLFSDASATKLFIQHLCREVSVENIFFLADVMGYKKSFEKYSHTKIESVTGFSCAVPVTLARLMFRRTFTHYAWAISKTYVDGSSAFYVTAITDNARSKCIEFFEDQNPGIEKKRAADYEHYVKLQNGFDSVAQEVYNAIKASYVRFAQSEEFKSIEWKGQMVGSKNMQNELQQALKNRGKSQ